jgi:hypothetical protein
VSAQWAMLLARGLVYNVSRTGCVCDGVGLGLGEMLIFFWLWRDHDGVV